TPVASIAAHSFFLQAADGIRDFHVTGVQTCALPISGVIRPAIGTYVPKISGGYGLLLDVGAVSDCNPEMLSQFGLLGSLFAEHVAGMNRPKVALLNIGEEEEKGKALTQDS